MLGGSQLFSPRRRQARFEHTIPPVASLNFLVNSPTSSERRSARVCHCSVTKNCTHHDYYYYFDMIKKNKKKVV
jgi:hypothetical protein